MTPPTRVTAERSPEIGESIGQYRLVGVLADVSAGRLYVAERQGARGASRTVALLRVHPSVARDPQFRTRFDVATRLAPRLQHPNVATTYEVGEVEGNHFASMEYLPGESLASILRKCYAGAHLSPDIAATLVKHTANAAQYVHELRLAEGLSAGPLDFDPSSIFVTYHGTVKLLAVGLRPTPLANGPQHSGMREAATWPPADGYRAPEERAGSPDVRTDVFHLGVMLWTCLTGRPPHRAYGSGEADAIATSRQMVAPSSVRAEVPEALDAIAARAMSPEARDRYQSVGAMSEALDHFLIRRDSRPTHLHIRRWMERQLFDPERASLQRQIAEGYDVEVALSLLATPRGASSSSGTSQRRSSARPRELWAVSHSRLARRSPGPPLLFEPEPGSVRAPSPGDGEELRTLPSFPASVSAAAISAAAPKGEPSTRPSPAPPAASGARWRIVGVTTAVGVIIAVTAVARFSSDLSSRQEAPRASLPPAASGQVEVRSVPAGAAVFVDGEPTGMRTPAVLRGLAEGRTLRVRVDKAGFAAQERTVSIAPGSVEALAFELLASEGRVRFTGVPEGGRVYVDEVLIAGGEGEPVRLPAGRHTLRVETPAALVFSDTVVVVAGEQTIRVDGAGESQ